METRIQEGKNGLVPSLYVCDVLRSLKMQKGEFAEAFWMGESTQGTYIYIPTGFDYWCAASDPIELATLKNLAQAISSNLSNASQYSKPMFSAVSLLAEYFPKGIREKGELRSLSPSEIDELVSKLKAREVQL
jgi:hypothetical protein